MPSRHPFWRRPARLLATFAAYASLGHCARRGRSAGNGIRPLPLIFGNRIMNPPNDANRPLSSIFRQSRIFAEGWNATRGRTISPSCTLLLAISLLMASGVARAAVPGESPAGAAFYASETHKPPPSTDLRYRTGAYFYGEDCGGNSAMITAPPRTSLPAGVILSGTAAHEMAGILNCDDRRNALVSYRDAFQGKIGQPYSWRNPNDGDSGNVTAARRYQDSGAHCTYFRAVATVSGSTSNLDGTACRQADGNWHTR